MLAWRGICIVGERGHTTTYVVVCPRSPTMHTRARLVPGLVLEVRVHSVLHSVLQSGEVWTVVVLVLAWRCICIVGERGHTGRFRRHGGGVRGGPARLAAFRLGRRMRQVHSRRAPQPGIVHQAAKHLGGTWRQPSSTQSWSQVPAALPI